MKNSKDVLISASTNKPVTNGALQPLIMWCHVCNVKISQPMAAIAHFAGKLHLDKAAGGTGALEFGPIKRKTFTDLDAPPSKFSRMDGGGRGGGGRGNYKKFQKPNNMSNEKRTNPWAFLGPSSGSNTDEYSQNDDEYSQNDEHSQNSSSTLDQSGSSTHTDAPPGCRNDEYQNYDNNDRQDDSNYGNYESQGRNGGSYQRMPPPKNSNDRAGYHQRMLPSRNNDNNGNRGGGYQRMLPSRSDNTGNRGGYQRMSPKRGNHGNRGRQRLLPPETESWNQGRKSDFKTE